jgi:hypothetical protein
MKSNILIGICIGISSAKLRNYIETSKENGDYLLFLWSDSPQNDGCKDVGGCKLCQSQDTDEWEKGACKLGLSWVLTGSLLGCFHFLAAAKKYFSDRQKIVKRTVKSISAAAKTQI